MSSPLLLFVEVTSNGKVLDKKARHAIQKHVMRDAAAERRQRSKVPRKMREGSKNPEEPIVVHSRKGKDVHPRPETYSASLRLDPPFGLGGGRMDPFAQYPVRMDLEKLFLIDYGS